MPPVARPRRKSAETSWILGRAPFAKRGVPALFAVGNPNSATTAADDPVHQRFADDLTGGYHKPADEYDAATWDLRGVEQDVRGFFETGWRVANDTRWPNWRYGNSFRTLRDHQP